MAELSAAKNLTSKKLGSLWISRWRTYFGNACLLALFLAPCCCLGQVLAKTPAIDLYRHIIALGLDPNQVYSVRNAALDREDIHIALDDGAIAFTEAIDGRITGALFDGEGTLLIVPPNQVERHSLGMFTDSAVLNQHFTKAYFRFDDSHFVSDLQPSLRALEDPSEFVEKENSIAKALSAMDALRLLVALTRDKSTKNEGLLTGEFLHARFIGDKGTFDASWDTGASEQIAAGQSSLTEHGAFYDQWMLFPMRSIRQRDEERHKKGLSNDQFYEDDMPITGYSIQARVSPPTELSADTTVKLAVKKSGERTLLFELSRYLKLSSVTMESDGAAVALEFIQNEAIEGTQLAKRGNDVTAVVFPQVLSAGEHLTLHFKYAGSVLSEAGGGLLYVGERGTWYPNRGPTMSNYDLQFEAPAEWKLLATGRLQSRQQANGQEVSRWSSERELPFAGFNLGKYTSASTTTANGQVEVSAYATTGVERAFPAAPSHDVIIKGAQEAPIVVPARPQHLVPAANVQIVADRARNTIDFLSPRLGAYPYSSLSLTQIPGPDSQGWPGLIYLSSHVFLTPQERAEGRGSNYAKSAEETIYNRLMESHETAHQWWGDAVLWQSYRDQWLMEALANYCALLEIESQSPEEAKSLLEYYRRGLLIPSPGGRLPKKDAGPVTFGLRLNSAPFPSAYEPVAYGRGTWLIHMLREMLRDATKEKRQADPDALFSFVLRDLQKKFNGKSISTQDFQLALENVWPQNLRYEGKKSLEWFFDGWVNGTAVPKIELKDVKLSSAGGKTIARATLVQRDAPDALITSVPIYAQTAAGLVYINRVFADGNESPIKLTAPAGTKKLVVDPYDTVLREK